MKKNYKAMLIAAAVITSLGVDGAQAGVPQATTVDQAAAKSAICITNAPHLAPGEGPLDEISGFVTGVSPGEYQIVIYAFGDLWYVQPWTASPFTRIQKDGTWRAPTHGGYEYAALLVKPTFHPPDTMIALPKVGGEVIAVAKVKPGH